jgi:outer membrane lipoprotein-sorting protein
MIGAFIFLAGVIQNQQLERDPGVVISKTILKYYNATTLSGTITQSISDGGGVKKITTLVSYARPNKIYVQQDFIHPNGLKANLTSDGKFFVYDPPMKLKSKPFERLYEPMVLPANGNNAPLQLTIGDLYHAAHTSLAPSTFLDIAIAYRQHLEDLKINVVLPKLAGVVDVDGKKAYHIVGDWGQALNSTPIGKFELWISTEFDLLKFVLTEQYAVNGRIVKLTTTETADLKVNATVNQALFKVVLPKS